MIPTYHDIYIPRYLDIKYPDIQSFRYPAHCLSGYTIGYTRDRPFGWPTCPSVNHFSDPRILLLSVVTLPAEQHRAGYLWTKDLPHEDLDWRPPYDGRMSIAPPLTLPGQKGPIFPKKIGASGGWAEPHLLAFTVP
ncbi:hypothetical protein [Sphingobacterium chuzhouense]|uniref:Uncharacterized protein n=1 Tax=Sphingobacterium chuzhouense TaxID=1742264 RepID=A0ABR7XPB5_9SPHI|nr:hypothetical protein [Sphingobacterium chuzhouense]MBD1421014.1 hypothetical protein [Sphingobacterium chuzhouense]